MLDLLRKTALQNPPIKVLDYTMSSLDLKFSSGENREQTVSEMKAMFRAFLETYGHSKDADLWLKYLYFLSKTAKDPRTAQLEYDRALTLLDSSHLGFHVGRKTLQQSKEKLVREFAQIQQGI